MIGLGLSLTRAALPMWSPRNLFAAGEQGMWLDPSDLSSLFQDAAGTTPVTATGQPVGLIKDKSGRGNHASQGTATSRPLLQQDASGRYYLAFDGVDDFLSCPYAQANYPLALAVGFYSASTSSVLGILSVASSTNASQYKTIAHEASANSIRGEDRNVADIVAAAPLTDMQPHVAIAQFGASSLNLYGDSAAPVAVANTNGFTSDFIFVGKLRNTGNLINGRVYGAVVLARTVTAGELPKLQRNLAGRAGVTL